MRARVAGTWYCCCGLAVGLSIPSGSSMASMLGTAGDEGIVGTLAGLMSIIAGVCGAAFGAAAFGAAAFGAAAALWAAARAAATAGDATAAWRADVFFLGMGGTATLAHRLEMKVRYSRVYSAARQAQCRGEGVRSARQRGRDGRGSMEEDMAVSGAHAQPGEEICHEEGSLAAPEPRGQWVAGAASDLLRGWAPLYVAGEGAMPSARGYSTAVVHAKRQIYAFGGSAGSSRKNDMWVHKDDSWTALDTAGSAPTPRNSHSAVLWEARSTIIVFGGWDGSRNCNDLYFFDIPTATWRPVVPGGCRACMCVCMCACACASAPVCVPVRATRLPRGLSSCRAAPPHDQTPQ